MATLLRVSRPRAEEIIAGRIAAGNDLLVDAKGVRQEGEHRDWRRQRNRWGKVTRTALLSVFFSEEYADEFATSLNPSRGAVMPRDWTVFFADDVDDVKNAITVLETLTERLDLLEESSVIQPDRAPSDPLVRETQVDTATPVFIVHGRNEERKTQVARMLERTGSHAVRILHEQPNQGQTVLEKFERHAQESGYAVILLTGDDMGGLRDDVEPSLADGRTGEVMSARGRQNVVLEMGFFFGALGRKNVAVLHEETVDLPSDIAGLLYIPLDSGGAWQAKLLLELRSAGFAYDLNNLT